MKRKAGNSGKTWSSKGMKNTAPPAPPQGPPQKIRLVQGGEPASQAAKPKTRGPTSAKPALSKKADAAVQPAKKSRR
jgi:hypothetical protein